MKIVFNLNKFKNQKVVIALGTFDGLHYGHRQLIESAKKKAGDLPLVVVTFYINPISVLNPEMYNGLLLNRKEREDIFDELGVDILHYIDFTKEFSQISPEDFFMKYLYNQYNIEALVYGKDYRFGKKAGGNKQLLADYAKKYNFENVIIDDVNYKDDKVSSSIIRECISKGEIQKANKLLGREYSLSGKIEKGLGNGKKFGFPTINLNVIEDRLIPCKGVYFTKTKYKSNIYYGMTNIGVNPTVSVTESMKIETYLIGLEKDIYYEEAEVFFIKYLREEKKFETKEELISQLKKDKENVLKEMVSYER